MSSVNYRMVPDQKRSGGTIVIGGKSTPVTASNSIDVPYEVANTLAGWINCGLVGTTAQRPGSASLSQYYIDTTIGAVIFSNGLGLWYNPISGAFV